MSTNITKHNQVNEAVDNGMKFDTNYNLDTPKGDPQPVLIFNFIT